ncbi:MAG TPA: hypothetical protein QF644_02595 [Candidatus Poseidoniaceae archaeon]|jgi:hypothetical protein|nr:hypothetical protein [Candidatus Poseidoniaceae archaeon]
MVESLQINKVQVKEKLIVDSLAKMENTEDFDFSPRVAVNGSDLIITSATNGEELGRINLEAEMLEIAERDRFLDLKVKFEVAGIHGNLNKINPIIATGKGKKLPLSSWKTTLPINFN